MNHHELYSMKNFDFLALSFARMRAQGHSVDLQAIVGNMDEEHREWFCQRYELYCHQVDEEVASEVEH